MRTAGSEFARASWMSVALYHHRMAREGGAPEDWRTALSLYETVLSRWPHDPDRPNLELKAGEASTQLGQFATALDHYEAAASSDRDSIVSLALWQRVAVTDAWYEKSRATARPDSEGLGSDSLAHAVRDAASRLLARFPGHPQGADLLWRRGQLAFAHGWFDSAATDFGRLAERHPGDDHAPEAATLRGDALFRLGRFEAAGTAYEGALRLALSAGRDSLGRRLALEIPISYYRHAESVATSDSLNFSRQAGLFAMVAGRWPTFEHADAAQYRAGLAYIKAGMPHDAVHAMQILIGGFPHSEFVRDAQLQIAKTRETAGERVEAALAYADFAERFPDDESAGSARLKAADLYEAAGRGPSADSLRLAYIRAYPADLETAMEILERLSHRELATVGPAHPISELLKRGSALSGPVTSTSFLAAYLKRAEAHPELSSRSVVAEVRFLQGEEAYAADSAAALTQPLKRSIPIKQKLLDAAIVRYRQSVDLGVPEWANASACRIGQALVAFGEALEKSDRPADLNGDDLQAYEGVLLKESQAFFDRGEGVWSDLLRDKGRQAPDDPWVKRAQTSLWERLRSRFYYRPEVEFPLVAAARSQGGRHKHARASDNVASRGGSKPDHDGTQRDMEIR